MCSHEKDVRFCPEGDAEQMEAMIINILSLIS